jgi:dipeptidase
MCDTLVAVTNDGVLFAKNSDRDPNEAQLLEWRPAEAHADGERVRCTYLEIPQAARTHAVLLSRPFWMWGAEIGANEHGVVIGNEAVFTREPYAKVGLTGMDLLRLGVERGATASEAVHTIVTLLERHGQGGGCGHEDRGFTYHNSFIVADAREAWVLETAGRLHATERVTGARSISNGLTISGFAKAHSDFVKTRASACAKRRARTESHAKGAVSPGDMMRALRDHGSHRQWPRYSLVNGGMASPCMHAGGLLAASQTTGSWVADLRGTRPTHWVTGTAAPCVSLFKPVRVDAPLDLGRSPTDRPDTESLWWRHERLHRRVMRDPSRLAPLFAGERDRVEGAWVREPPSPRDAFAEGDRLLTQWTARVAAQPERDRRPLWVRRYWAKRSGWLARA